MSKELPFHYKPDVRPSTGKLYRFEVVSLTDTEMCYRHSGQRSNETSRISWGSPDDKAEEVAMMRELAERERGTLYFQIKDAQGMIDLYGKPTEAVRFYLQAKEFWDDFDRQALALFLFDKQIAALTGNTPKPVLVPVGMPLLVNEGWKSRSPSYFVSMKSFPAAIIPATLTGLFSKDKAIMMAARASEKGSIPYVMYQDAYGIFHSEPFGKSFLVTDNYYYYIVGRDNYAIVTYFKVGESVNAPAGPTHKLAIADAKSLALRARALKLKLNLLTL